jgi:hypothetical protein
MYIVIFDILTSASLLSSAGVKPGVITCPSPDKGILILVFIYSYYIFLLFTYVNKFYI